MVKVLVVVGVVIASVIPSALGFASEAWRRRIAAPVLEFPSSAVIRHASTSPPTDENNNLVNHHEEVDIDLIVGLNGEDIAAAATLRSSPSPPASPWTREESARQLTEFMAKAHEEKLRAIRAVESTYRAEILELKGRLEKYENEDGAAIATAQTRHGGNSFEFPATNKAMGEKIREYQRFVSDYVVKAQQEKLRAVSAAEKKAKERYEAIIVELTKQLDEFKP